MLSRRHLLQTTASGFGYLAFSALAQAQERAADANPLAPKRPHFAPKAKRVIFLCMDGGPSHVDTFDYKPKLIADNGKPSNRGRFGGATLLGPTAAFRQRGQSGQWISDLFPELANRADDLCLLNGMHTDLPAHPQAFLQMHCGIFQFPRPSLGAWVLYGLGTENANLPGFVSISPPSNNSGPANYGSSFLPAAFQGTRVDRSGQIANLANPRRSVTAQRQQLDFLQQLNRSEAERGGDAAAIDGLIGSYELAFRMQAEMPKVMDLTQETRETQALYGIGGGRGGGGGFGGGFGPGGGDSFGRACLSARRLVEAGVRFVEVNLGGWDHHQNLKESLERNCAAVDKPAAALLTDLKRRGLLDDTLVIWGGEFGRTPAAQGANGRDHNNKGYSMWMAGGGVKGGLRHGATDDYGFEAVTGKVHVHDWHATILHLLGLDHEKLTFRHAGRDMRLTDVKGTVVREVLA
ncbi:DUF1501 domain-containing protein [Urbifossiella limnaea]|uniref:DUF1501 domain-containing protein n=1 Tax=Urbifossiella limnaea TaxID=2528023 RepID=A0A517Y097_9BACT|nr:DUF1501 domain-containing protein [Urbifossiella limnaea]QDU23187.1 hypothetical protein ETAA1_51790 [Urbifossiella limnaea]